MNIDEKRKLLKTLQTKEERVNEYIKRWTPSVIQRAAIASKAKITMVVGGNQSGKSEIGGMRTAVCSTGIIPASIEEDFPRELIRHGDYWCSALDFGGARDIIRHKLDTILPDRVIGRFSKDDKIYYLKDPVGQIGLKSEESGESKYQGVQRLGIWMDEEHTKEVFDEIFERVTTLRGWIFFTFSPIEGLTWSYEELYKKAKKIYYTENVHGIPEDIGTVHTLDEIRKLKDRKLCFRENSSDKADPNIAVYIISKYDNIHLPDEEIQNSERKYQFDPPQYQARILGRYAKITNNCAFSTDRLLKMQLKCINPIKRGRIVNGQLQLDVNGELSIYKDKKPLGQGYYVIGADIAQGTELGDYSVAQILDHKTCEQVAVWHGKVHPEKFASILIELGKYYNIAYLAPERNFHGFGVVNRIREQKYKRLFSEYDQASETINVSGACGEKKYGWETNAKTRPIMIQDLAVFISEGHIKLNDYDTLEELLTFVYDKDGKAQALKGCYDDRVMALAIALQVFQLRAVPKHEFKPHESKNLMRKNEMGYEC